jgi:hypothetical protein
MMITETDFDVKIHASDESLADGCVVKKHQARSASATAATTTGLPGLLHVDGSFRTLAFG